MISYQAMTVVTGRHGSLPGEDAEMGQDIVIASRTKQLGGGLSVIGQFRGTPYDHTHLLESPITERQGHNAWHGYRCPKGHRCLKRHGCSKRHGCLKGHGYPRGHGCPLVDTVSTGNISVLHTFL